MNCVGDPTKRPEKEGHNRKKRVTWKSDENSNKKKKKRKERAEKSSVEVKPDPLSELDERMALISESLNDLYVDEFGGDIEVLSFWLNARARERK